MQLAFTRSGQHESERAVLIRGQAKTVNRAIQMVKAAVMTHHPSWQFSPVVERLLQDFKEAENDRIASKSDASTERWTLNHFTFIPEQSIPAVKLAIFSNTFVVSSCAIIKLDPVVLGKVTIDAPTTYQVDAALIHFWDVVRSTVPDWMPESSPARELIEEADKQAGPGVQARQRVSTCS